jgi:SNF2 family DNA or RNA helicase
MRPELRDYQKEDAIKLNSKYATACFNQQRTGKTPTSIRAMCARDGVKKILIICPASLMYQWQEEFIRWSGRPCNVAAGTKVKRNKAIDTWTDGLVINYATLRSYKKKLAKNAYEEVNGHADKIKRSEPDGVILDEAHRIKGRVTATARAVNQLKGVKHKIALTATPAPSHPSDVWPILHWLYPGVFKSYWKFVKNYFDVSSEQYGGAVIYKPTKFKPIRERAFQHMLDDFTTNRKRIDVMPWLPDVPEPTRIKLPLSKYQLKYLDDLDSMFQTGHVIVQGHLDRLIRYRQICNAPEILDLRGKSPKIEWLQQYMSDYPEVPTIIFSKQTKFLRLIEKKTKGKVKLLEGNTTAKKRQDLISDFQSGNIKLLAIQIDAGKEGLTLDTAEKIIFLDVYPPAADISQAQDRFIATVKSKADIPKEVIYVMMKDSYDEELYNLVDLRRDETEVVNAYIKFINKE